MKCPKCKSTALIKSGKTAKGTQRYQCKYCGAKTTENSVSRFSNPEKIKCWKCGSTDIKKKGYTRNGKQMYFCRSCKKKFVEFSETRYLQEAEKNLIIRYHEHLGVAVTDIAKHIHRSTRTIYDYLDRRKKNENHN